ncbi:MAG: nickel pincer cofactor biosynthesis protein LarB [Pseudomonadota bacterium]
MRDVLEALARGELTVDDAAAALAAAPTAAAAAAPASLDLGHTTLDLDRASRTGDPEVVFAQGKSVTQLEDIARAFAASGEPLLVTRLAADKATAMRALLPDAVYAEEAQLLHWRALTPDSVDRIAIVAAGTSDHAVAEEARLTCEFYGQQTLPINDVGVAGIHRLFARLEEIRSARVVIVVAGMEGALPSVVGGLVSVPVIAVPTSVGYGAAFGGLAALLGMLNTCASGVSVVNIDNGFGAGYLATLINRR